MVRLDRIEKRLTRLEEEKDNGENEDEDQQKGDVVVQEKADAVVQPPKVKSVVKQKLRKVIKKKKRSAKRKKKKKGSGEIRVHATVRASKKIYSSDPKTHLHAKAGDEFQVLRIHKDEGKLFVMNKRTEERLHPYEQFRI